MSTRTLLHFRGGPRDGQAEPHGVEARLDPAGHAIIPVGYLLEDVCPRPLPRGDHVALRWIPDVVVAPRRLPDQCCEPVHPGCVLWRRREASS